MVLISKPIKPIRPILLVELITLTTLITLIGYILPTKTIDTTKAVSKIIDFIKVEVESTWEPIVFTITIILEAAMALIMFDFQSIMKLLFFD